MLGSFFGKIGIEAGFLNEPRVFKVNYGFHEDGGYPEDLCDKNFNYLYLYSNMYRNERKIWNKFA